MATSVLNPILVVGATGFLGGEICRRLAAQGRSVRDYARRVMGR